MGKSIKKLILICVAIVLSAVSGYAGSTNSMDEPKGWTIDKRKTAGGIAKLSSMVLLPALLFISGAVVRPQEYKNAFYISGAVTAVPALAGSIIITVDLIRYNPNEDESKNLSPVPEDYIEEERALRLGIQKRW